MPAAAMLGTLRAEAESRTGSLLRRLLGCRRFGSSRGRREEAALLFQRSAAPCRRPPQPRATRGLAAAAASPSPAAEERPAGAKAFVVAIDGPAASGKSTTARLVAGRLGFVHVDTGAMYRAITLAAVRTGLDPDRESNADAIAALVAQVRVGFGTAGETNRSSGSTRIFLGAEDVTEVVRTTPAVAGSVTAVARIPAVRSCLVRRQRSFAGGGAPGGLVMDGRDIGTTVFPDANLKVFVVADPQVRALRRWRQEKRRGADPAAPDGALADGGGAGISEEDEESAVQRIKEDLELRDKQDAERAVSPLRKADDAVVLDTTHLTVDEQVSKIVELARQRMSRTSGAASAQRTTSL